ncbi:Aminopeptidase N, partial [Orchesella cincta]
MLIILLLICSIHIAEAIPPHYLESFPEFLFASNIDTLPAEYGVSKKPGLNYRLPNTIKPLHYFLKVRPLFDNEFPRMEMIYTIQGFVRVTALCIQSTNIIVLHKRYLEINESTIHINSKTNENETIRVMNVEYDDERDFIFIHLKSLIKRNQTYDISINYTAFISPTYSSNGLGMYTNKFFDPTKNETKLIAITQLQATRARTLLPCWDEPLFKTTFDVVIGRTENYTALSNGPLEKTEADDENPGWFWDTFKTTAKMPSYSLAMGIADYVFSEATKGLYRLPVRVSYFVNFCVTTPQTLHKIPVSKLVKILKVYAAKQFVNNRNTQLAADSSAKLMQYYETKYGVPYGMPKLDSISVPDKKGAMENYGLITYSQALLLYFEGDTLTTDLRRNYGIMAHEISHQWFGNSVTCKCTVVRIMAVLVDFWLNEGFATYASTQGLQALWPDFEAKNYFVHGATNAILKYDDGTQPVHNEAYTPEQIKENIVKITYSKGAAIIRMMESFLGEETFTNGIKSYHTQLREDVAEQDDLFSEMTSAAIDSDLQLPLSVAEIMHSWTLQPGFPLVRVAMNSSSNVMLTQETWQNAIKRNGSHELKFKWNIPIRYLMENDLRGGFLWLLQEEGVPTIALKNDNDWVLINTDAGGFEKYIPIQKSLQFTKYLNNETDYTVWSAVLYQFLKIRRFYAQEGSQDYKILKGYLLPRIQSALKLVTGNGSANKILRSDLHEWCCALNSTSCREITLKYYELWAMRPDVNPVPIDDQYTFYCKMVDFGGYAAFNFLYKKYKATNNRQQKSRMSAGLACTHDSHLLRSLLSFVLEPEPDGIEHVDSVPVLQGMLESADGRNHLLAMMKKSPKIFLDYYNNSSDSLIEILDRVSGILGTEEDASKFEAFVRDTQDVFKGGLNKTLDKVLQNVKWMNDFREPMTTWLSLNT